MWSSKNLEIQIEAVIVEGELCNCVDPAELVSWDAQSVPELSLFASQILVLILLMCVTLLIASLICLTLPGRSSACSVAAMPRCFTQMCFILSVDRNLRHLTLSPSSSVGYWLMRTQSSWTHFCWSTRGQDQDSYVFILEEGVPVITQLSCIFRVWIFKQSFVWLK